MQRDRQEVINSFVSMFADDTREEITGLLEDLTDSWQEPDNYVTNEKYNDLESKYNDSIKAYRERFTQGDNTPIVETEPEPINKVNVKSFDELFK